MATEDMTVGGEVARAGFPDDDNALLSVQDLRVHFGGGGRDARHRR